MSAMDLHFELDQAFRDARAGDGEAFGRLVALTQGMLTALSLAITGDRAASEDIAQETYLEAWRRLPTMDGQRNLLPWLREVARNKSIDLLRRRRHDVAPFDAHERFADTASAADEPQEALAAEQRRVQAWRAMSALSQSDREVILLYYREGQRSDQVAALVGVSTAVLRKRLQRARDRLRSEVDHEVGSFALETAPGTAFGMGVVAMLGSTSRPAAAAGALAVQSGGKAMLAKLFGALGTAAAAVGVVLLAVLIDTRIHLARSRDRVQRRKLIVHGVAYALLMAAYVLGLRWASHAGAGTSWVAGMAVTATLLVFVLTFWRVRILRRTTEGT